MSHVTTPPSASTPVRGSPIDSVDNGSISKGLPKQQSTSALHSYAGMSTGIIMNASKVHALRRSIDERTETVSTLLMSSRDSVEKRAKIDSAFRSCKEGFSELASAYLALLDKSMNAPSFAAETVKEIVTEVVSRVRIDTLQHKSAGLMSVEGVSPACSYASAVKSKNSTIHLARGPTVSVKKSTDILVRSCLRTRGLNIIHRETLVRIIKPANFNLKVNRISTARNNGVRIEAQTVDLLKIKNSSELAKAGLRVEQISKSNPRLIVHRIPVGLSKEEIRDEIIVLNLDKFDVSDFRVVYVFPHKAGRRFTSCVIETPPSIRTYLRQQSHIYVKYSSCVFEDYMRVLQCFKCLAFGHLARDCKSLSLCGHCAEEHEMLHCLKKEEAAVCGNCKRWLHTASNHSALDGRACPILNKKLQEKVKNINYDE